MAFGLQGPVCCVSKDTVGTLQPRSADVGVKLLLLFTASPLTINNCELD